MSPEGYAHLTHMLCGLADGKVIVVLEVRPCLCALAATNTVQGGYNVSSIANSMTACVKTLLGDPLPTVEPGQKLSRR